MSEATNVVHITEQARERHRECMDAIAAALKWAEGADLSLDDAEGWEEAREIVAERRKSAREMEHSFLTNFARLFFTPASDGMLTIHSDFAPLSFFWRYESGYHGGLIYHASHVDGVRQPVGTWSVHT